MRASGGLPKERARLAATIIGAGLLVVAFAAVEPLRAAAIEAFRSIYLFSALVAG